MFLYVVWRDGIELIDGEIGQQIPMLGQWGTVDSQPFPLRARYRFPAKRALGRETKRLQLVHSPGERSGQTCFSLFPGPLTGKSDHESKTVLSVAEPGARPSPLRRRNHRGREYHAS